MANGLVAQLHLKNINRHNDSLIHTRFSLFINTEIIQPQNSNGFCKRSVSFLILLTGGAQDRARP
ncbi:hypothetical protein CAP57_03270 [Enterobacter kobei]|nr:hypothetical protein CAP57_03270 [Enterobacter kobei]